MNNYDVKLRFGMKDGKIVEITEVESGLACDCVCPLCGGRLEAIKGEKRAWHFRHYGEECNLVNAQQSAIHILAKEIIAEEKAFMFPGYTIGKVDLNKKYKLHYDLPGILEKYTKNSVKGICDSVVCEKRVSDIVPDIIVNVGEKECIIEIAVTHFVDEIKRNKIIETGIPTVEVDLSDYINEPEMREKLKDILVNKDEHKKWIYNPQKNKKLKEAEKDYDELHKKALDERNKKEAEEYRKFQTQREKIKLEEQKREKAEILLNSLFEKENYEKEIRRLRSDEKFYTELQKRTFNKSLNGIIPFYIDIPITGEFIFECDRRIWQSAVFDTFIYNRFYNDGKALVDEYKIIAYIKENIQINWEIAYKTKVNINGNTMVVSLINDVIKTYIGYLKYIGFVKEDGIYNYVASAHSLKSPLPPNAEILRNILKETDRLAPNIDDIVREKLYLKSKKNASKEDNKHSIVKYNRKKIKRTAAEKLKEGYKEALKFDFESETPFYDSFDMRWVKCVECGHIKSTKEMVQYGGKEQKINHGICRECYMKKGNS
ncbi:MAG: hypothetical protein IJN37_07140 [Clostridia bacterium]|nr:hypothetical protein [Clostridia bacterium]